MLEKFKETSKTYLKKVLEFIKQKLKAFSVAEMMVVMLIMSIALAAAAPIIAKRTRVTGASPEAANLAINLANNAAAGIKSAYDLANSAYQTADQMYTRLDETIGMIQDGGQSKAFTTPGTDYFTLPPGVTRFKVYIRGGAGGGGGGGGGCTGSVRSDNQGCGGAGGETSVMYTSPVQIARPGTVITVNVADGGGGGAPASGCGDGSPGNPGGISSVVYKNYKSISTTITSSSPGISGGVGGGASSCTAFPRAGRSPSGDGGKGGDGAYVTYYPPSSHWEAAGCCVSYDSYGSCTQARGCCCNGRDGYGNCTSWTGCTVPDPERWAVTAGATAGQKGGGGYVLIDYNPAHF